MTPDLPAAEDDPAALIDRSDDWWAGYRAGAETRHAAHCAAIEAERNLLSTTLAEAKKGFERRLRDLQTEWGRRVAGYERLLKRRKAAAEQDAEDQLVPVAVLTRWAADVNALHGAAAHRLAGEMSIYALRTEVSCAEPTAPDGAGH